MSPKVRLARRKASVSSFRVVPEKKWHETLEKWQAAATRKPGRVQLVSDSSFHGVGLAAAEIIGPRGKKGIVSIARDARIQAHEREHVENLAWFRRRGILPARTSFLAVLEEFSMRTRMIPRHKRKNSSFIRIRNRILHGNFSTFKEIQELFESISLHFPTEGSFLRARLSVLKSPQMKPHLEALNSIRQAGVLVRYSPKVLEHVRPHLLAILKFFEKKAQGSKEKIE